MGHNVRNHKAIGAAESESVTHVRFRYPSFMAMTKARLHLGHEDRVTGYSLYIPLCT